MQSDETVIEVIIQIYKKVGRMMSIHKTAQNMLRALRYQRHITSKVSNPFPQGQHWYILTAMFKNYCNHTRFSSIHKVLGQTIIS